MFKLSKVFNIQILRVLFGFIILYYIIDKYMHRYLFNASYSEALMQSLIFYLPSSMMIIFSTAFFIIFYHIGKQVKRLCGFQYVTTGVIGFFAATFLFNLILCVLRVSSPKVEIIGLLAFTAFLLSMSVIESKGYKEKTILLFLLMVSFLIIYKISGIITVNRFPFDLNPSGDEVGFWYPMSVKYFDNGLLYAIKNNTFPGYGLFVQHVWITIKRLTFFNLNSSYFFPPKLLFLLGLGFIGELKLRKGIIVFAILIYVFSISADGWLRFLLMGGLYGEGVTSLFFTIILREILNNIEYPLQNNKVLTISRIGIFWTISGVLYLTKPFISYICFLLPFFYTKIIAREQKAKWIAGVILRVIPMLIFPVLWKINNITNDMTSSYFSSKFSPSLLNVDLGVISQIYQHWIIHYMTMGFYVLSIIGALIGITASNRHRISSSLFFVCLNFLLICGLYLMILGNNWIQSAFRHFSQTYYLCLYALMLGLSKIFEDMYICLKNMFVKIGARYNFLDFAKSTKSIEETVLSLWQRKLWKIITVIVFLLFIAINFIYFHSQDSVFNYKGFYLREKWPSGAYYRWTDKEATIKLRKGGLLELTYICSHPDVEMNPVILSVSLNTSDLDKISFVKKGAITRRYHIPGTSNKSAELHFKISRTWNPINMGISSDTRNLGVAISEVKYLNNTSTGYVGFYNWENLNAYKIPGWPHDVPQRFRWTGKQATIKLGIESKNGLRLFLMCANPRIDEDPILVNILSDDKLIYQEKFSVNQWKDVLLAPAELKDRKTLTIQVSRTWNPKASGYSEDDRDLGVAVAVPELGN